MERRGKFKLYLQIRRAPAIGQIVVQARHLPVAPHSNALIGFFEPEETLPNLSKKKLEGKRGEKKREKENEAVTNSSSERSRNASKAPPIEILFVFLRKNPRF